MLVRSLIAAALVPIPLELTYLTGGGQQHILLARWVPVRTIRVCSILLTAVAALAVPAVGQSVISTRSGVIYYFDGFVYLDDQQLEPHLGKFSSVPQGSELRTALGRAEVLLTPGVFLRLSDKSAIRMLANDLANTRVELQTGSAIMDSAAPNFGTAVTLVFRDWQVRSPQAGTYRIDSDPPHLWVLKGEAEVVAGAAGKPVTVKQGMDLPLAASLVPEQSTAEPADGLSDWAKGRRESIDADNMITQQIDSDPGTSQPADLGGLSHFPLLGLTSAGLSYNLYSSVPPSQAGFYSIYLPGYTYAPVFLRVMVGGIGTHFRVFPPRVRVLPGIGGTASPHPSLPSPVPTHPIVRTPAPTHPHSAYRAARH